MSFAAHPAAVNDAAEPASTHATGVVAFPKGGTKPGHQPADRNQHGWKAKPAPPKGWMVHAAHHRHQAQQQEQAKKLERMTHAVEHAGRWAPGPRHPSSEPMQRIDAGQASTPSSMHPAPMERPWEADRARMPSASHAAGPQPSSYRPGAQQPSASTSPPGARTLHGDEARAARAAHLTDGHTAWPDGAAAAAADEWPNPAAPVSHVDADARRAYAGPSRPGDHMEGPRYASQAPSTGQPWTDWSQPPPRRTQPARTVIRTYPVHRVPRQMARMEMYEEPAYVEVCEYAAPRLRPARHYARMPHQMPHQYRPAMAAPADWYDYAAEPEACHCPACQSLMAEYGQDVDEYSVSGTYEPMSTDMEYCVQPRIRYSSRPAPTRMVWADPPPRTTSYMRPEHSEIHSSTADFSDRGWVDVHDSPHTPGMVHETDEYAPGMQAGRPWGPQYTKMHHYLRYPGPGRYPDMGRRHGPAYRSTLVHSHESDAPVTGMWEGTARPVTHAAGAPQLSRHASMGSLHGRSEDGTPKMNHWPSQYDPAAQHPVESREQRPGHHAGQGPTRGDQGLQHQQSQLSDDDAEEQQGYHEEPAAHNPYMSHAHDAALRQGNQQPAAGPHTASQPHPWQERHTSQSQQAPEHRSHQAPHHHTPAPAQATAHAMPHGVARDQFHHSSSPEHDAVTLQQAGFTAHPGSMAANQLTRGAAHSLPAAGLADLCKDDDDWASIDAALAAFHEPGSTTQLPGSHQGNQSRAPETPGQAVPPHASFSPLPPARLGRSALGMANGSQQQLGADGTRAGGALRKPGLTYQGLQGSTHTGSLATRVTPASGTGAASTLPSANTASTLRPLGSQALTGSAQDLPAPPKKRGRPKGSKNKQSFSFKKRRRPAVVEEGQSVRVTRARVQGVALKQMSSRAARAETGSVNLFDMLSDDEPAAPPLVITKPASSDILMNIMPSREHTAGSSQTLTASSPDDSCSPSQDAHTLQDLVVPRDILHTWAASETLQANAPGFLIRALGAGCWEALLGYSTSSANDGSDLEVWYECGRIESVTVKPGQESSRPSYLLVARFGSSDGVRMVQLEEVSNEAPPVSEVSHWLHHGGSISASEAAHLRLRLAAETPSS